MQSVVDLKRPNGTPGGKLRIVCRFLTDEDRAQNETAEEIGRGDEGEESEQEEG